MTFSEAVWKRVRLADILTYLDECVDLEDDKEYLTITVKRRHGGLEMRERLCGHEIKTKKQFRLVPGSFIISRIQCWHQAYAIVGDVASNAIASINYDQFAISSEVHPRFFWWLSHTPEFTETVRSSASGVVIEKMVFNRNAWLEKTVLLPPFHEQQRIVARIEEIFAQVEKARALRQQSVEEAEALHNSARMDIFTRDDLQEYRVCLGDADVVINRESRNPSRSHPDSIFTYVDISSVGTGPTVINTGTKMAAREAPSRARRVIRKNDLIISTVRPYLRAFAKIGEGMDNQICSTGFAVLTCGPSLMPDFLLHQFCSPFFVNQCMSHTTGGHYPAINDSNLRQIVVIAPSLAEQHRIVAELDALDAEVNALKRLQAKTAAELDALMPSILDRAFKGEL